MLGRCGDVYAKRRAGERLAVGAVTDGERRGIDLCLEGDLAAMAVSVDLHASCPVIVRSTVMRRRISPKVTSAPGWQWLIIMSVSSGVSAPVHPGKGA